MLTITRVKTFLVDGGFRPWTFVKIETSDGTVGWGDCTDWGSPRPVVAMVERPDGLIVQARQAGARRSFETFRLSDADLQALVQDTLRRLGTGRLGPPEPAKRAGHPRLLPSKPSLALPAADEAPIDAPLPS